MRGTHGGDMIRRSAIIANVLLLLAVILLTATYGIPDASEVWIVVIMTISPILSLLALHRSANNTNRESFIALWLKRKAMEERARIAALSNETRD